MLPPILRHILGSWLFQKFFRSKKRPYPGQITFWKYNGKSIFWLFKILTETLQKKFRIEKCIFSFQICFRNQFSTSGSGQTKNTQYAYWYRVFGVIVTPECLLVFMWQGQVTGDRCQVKYDRWQVNFPEFLDSSDFRVSIDGQVTCQRWQVTHDAWHMTGDTWHVTYDRWYVTVGTWHVTYYTWFCVLSF